MNRRCLYCYEPLGEKEAGDYHERCSMQFFGTKVPPVFAYTLDQMTELAKNVVERSIAVPGMQPKLSLTVLKEKLADGPRGRLTVVGALGGNYIFKPPSAEYPEMPANEHVTMRMAEEAFGLPMVPSSLIRLASGELAYITKRIDRTPDGTKIHMLDMFQIIEAFDKYKSSMERVGKAINACSDRVLLDQLKYFRLTLFCYLSGNNDMHLKNFSMIYSKKAWVLSPAYDLLNVGIANPKDLDELALTLDGKKSRFKLGHFNQFGAGLGLTDKQLNNSYSVFLKGKDAAFKWLDNSFLSEEMVDRYKTLMDKRYALLSEAKD
jgi:serine/threonine-protein kinase HipA